MGKLRRCTQRISQCYTQYIEKHGMGFVVTACVAVIVGSAMWTNANTPAAPVAPVFPTGEARLAAELLQESLADAVRPTAAPTEAPPQFHAPVTSVSVLTPFDAVRLQRSAVTGIWRLHDAVDLAVQPGEQIMAIADGVVICVSEDTLHGSCVDIDHGEVTACYMGMQSLAGIRAGDPVSQGQTIGFGGGCMADEADLPRHLHLRVLSDGQAIDSLSLWKHAEH